MRGGETPVSGATVRASRGQQRASSSGYELSCLEIKLLQYFIACQQHQAQIGVHAIQPLGSPIPLPDTCSAGGTQVGLAHSGFGQTKDH